MFGIKSGPKLLYGLSGIKPFRAVQGPRISGFLPRFPRPQLRSVPDDPRLSQGACGIFQVRPPHIYVEWGFDIRRRIARPTSRQVFCALDGSGHAYDRSTRAFGKALGLKLKEVEDWNCCARN